MKSKAGKLFCLMLCTVLVTALFPFTASADMGPKPSVNISFEGLGDELCYATLLSKRESTGPSSVWDGIEENAQHNENKGFDYVTLDYETWKAFAEYDDPDGYHFLQEGWLVNETKEFAWTYYPPDSFKILLYFPDSNIFVTSGIYERYAFDSYYTVDMTGIQPSVEGNNSEYPLLIAEPMPVEKSYDYSKEIVLLVARIVLTIILETGIALLFGLTEKKVFLLIVAVNTVTQIILNVLLNIVNYKSGYMAFVLAYILFEIIVFVIEAVLYCSFIKKVSEQPKKQWVYIAYALVANLVSFGAGIVISVFLPAIEKLIPFIF